MTWRELRTQVAEQLGDAGIVPADAEARFLVERASGYDADEWLEIAEIEPPKRAAQRLREMVERRVAGEPLQYVLGAWSFRGLDLWIDKRVLIPRPETEIVVEVALEEAVRLGLRRSRRHLTLVEPAPEHYVADLGTGSGAIALALEAELPGVEVWATDLSPDALAVARANVAGCAAARVRLARPGSWFSALPSTLQHQLSLIVSNPPYVTEKEFASLPAEVADYEPHDALVAGDAGTEGLDELLRDAPEWLAPGGTIVLELAPHQAAEMIQRAAALGYVEPFVRDDLAGRARVLVARSAS
jgi:release factor glutamine methyltransferase